MYSQEARHVKLFTKLYIIYIILFGFKFRRSYPYPCVYHDVYLLVGTLLQYPRPCMGVPAACAQIFTYCVLGITERNFTQKIICSYSNTPMSRTSTGIQNQLYSRCHRFRSRIQMFAEFDGYCLFAYNWNYV